MARYFISLGLFFCIEENDLMAQGNPIQLDRPDQTECPFIVPQKYIQVENGFTYEYAGSGQKTFSYPSTLWKYGVNSNIELRLITELVTERNNNTYSMGLLPLTVGFKAGLLEEKGLIPKTSFIGHITTAGAGSNDFKTSYIAPSFRFTMQHTLSQKISIAYNLGAEWDGETPRPTYIYTLTTGIALSERVGGFVELYGFAPVHDKADHRFDGGLTCLLNNDLMIDLSAGVGLTNNAPDYFVSLGLSCRFSVKKRK